MPMLSVHTVQAHGLWSVFSFGYVFFRLRIQAGESDALAGKSGRFTLLTADLSKKLDRSALKPDWLHYAYYGHSRSMNFTSPQAG
jgi:hypothetical protein